MVFQFRLFWGVRVRLFWGVRVRLVPMATLIVKAPLAGAASQNPCMIIFRAMSMGMTESQFGSLALAHVSASVQNPDYD